MHVAGRRGLCKTDAERKEHADITVKGTTTSGNSITDKDQTEG